MFRLALRQTEGLIGSIIGLLGIGLRVPDHSTLSRRAATLQVPRPKAGSAPVHLLVDSTGLTLCGAGEWLIEKHGTHARRSWRKLHISLDAETGQIVTAALTTKDVDDAAQVGPLLDQIDEAVASFTANGAYDQSSTWDDVLQRHPDAAVVIPPRSTAVPSETAESAPTQRDRHLRCVEPRGSPDIAEHGRMGRSGSRFRAYSAWSGCGGWQKRSSYNRRARAEAAIAR